MMRGSQEKEQVIATILASGKDLERRLSGQFIDFWVSAVAADARLAILRDDPVTRAEVERCLRQWRGSLDDRLFNRDWTKAEIDLLAGRVLSVTEEIGAILDDFKSLGQVVDSKEMETIVVTIYRSLLGSLSELAPAAGASKALAKLPARKGGRGKFTADHRARPVEIFGLAMVPLFRRSGLPLGGNQTRDKGFAAFLDCASWHVTGERIPGRAALLARLRMR